MKKQRGMSFIALVLLIALGVSIILLGAQLVPAYIEYWSVRKVLRTIANDPGFETMSPADILNSFERRATIDYISVIDKKDLEITKVDGKTVVTAEYSQRVPLVFNISACLDFRASTSDTKGGGLLRKPQE